MSTEADRLRQEAAEYMLFPQLTREELAGILVVDRAEGLYVWDTDGNRYLDGGSGGPYAVNVGHGREEIAKAAYDQMARAHYFMPWASITPVAVEFARKLAQITPGDLNYSFMSNAGCMAVEAAFKAVRQYFLFNGPDKRRYKIITRRGAYHGVTLGALAATGSYYPLRQMGEPLPPGYYFAAAPYCYRCEFGREYPNCNLECALSIETIIRQESPEQVAGVIGEVVMGAAGMIPPAPEYWPKVREICDKYGIFLIDDEVVCGFGRTGKWFGIEHYGVVPDVMAMAKGISSAYLPLAATAVTKKVADGLTAYWNVHTY
ncbi:MAG: aminotransferase class III-fold pyridoxal phosphate-dependent enzyme, partial [Chloroflexi bacterium]|nr:aminotransferase class III-fold pyridoxal phosphate-dependent enzyme [Chloroflexota bacterium]